MVGPHADDLMMASELLIGSELFFFIVIFEVIFIRTSWETFLQFLLLVLVRNRICFSCHSLEAFANGLNLIVFAHFFAIPQNRESTSGIAFVPLAIVVPTRMAPAQALFLLFIPI